MKIYLAGPYTSGCKNTVDARVKALNAMAAKLMNDGHIVFSPISHSHPIAMENDLPTTFDFWQAQNHEFIEWADLVVVVMLPGWDASRGVADEIEFARNIKKNILKVEALNGN